MNKDELVSRKKIRLKNYDYSQNGAYFITICVKDKKPILSKVIIEPSIVGNAVPGIPSIKLSKYGKSTEKIILQIADFYDNIKIDKYVIMPNHLHLIISINNSGTPRTAYPTISRYIATMKRFINKEIGENIWQSSFYDHIIRDDEDYYVKAQYIEDNPFKWKQDELYIKTD